MCACRGGISIFRLWFWINGLLTYSVNCNDEDEVGFPYWTESEVPTSNVSGDVKEELGPGGTLTYVISTIFTRVCREELGKTPL